MKRRTVLLGATGVVENGVRSEILLQARASWDGVEYGGYPAGPAEVTVRKIRIPAGGELEWHSHPMPGAAYVVKGEITVEMEGGARRRFGAGEALAEPVGRWHRGRAGAEEAEFLVFYAGAAGMPLSKPRS